MYIYYGTHNVPQYTFNTYSNTYMFIISEQAKRASSVMFVFNRDFRYVRIYIYMAVRPAICSSLRGNKKLHVLVVRNVGRVKFGSLSKA